MLAKQAEATFQSPSSIIGLVQGSYEAYCLDQAVWFVGATIQNDLEKAGHKRQKGEANIVAARRRVLAKYMGDTNQEKQFADPAALFN